jgi:hypothetical protein
MIKYTPAQRERPYFTSNLLNGKSLHLPYLHRTCTLPAYVPYSGHITAFFAPPGVSRVINFFAPPGYGTVR